MRVRIRACRARVRVAGLDAGSTMRVRIRARARVRVAGLDAGSTRPTSTSAAGWCRPALGLGLGLGIGIGLARARDRVEIG